MVTTLINLLGGPKDNNYGDKIANLILPEANTDASYKDNPKSSDFIHLDVNGTTIETIFPATWSIRGNGSQHVIVSPDKRTICQSLVYGIDDFNAFSEAAHGDLLSAEKEVLYRSLRSTAPPEASVIVRGTRISSAEGLTSRAVFEFLSETSVGSRHLSRSSYALWTHNAVQAAHLACSQNDPSEAERENLRKTVEGYAIAPKP